MSEPIVVVMHAVAPAQVAVCACCGRAPDRLRAPKAARDVTAPTQFPLCLGCAAHTDRAEEIGPGWSAALALTCGLAAPLYDRAWRRVEAMCSPECASAVGVPAAPRVEGGAFVVTLHNHFFAHHFARANQHALAAMSPALQALLAQPPRWQGAALPRPRPALRATAAALGASIGAALILSLLLAVTSLWIDAWLDPTLAAAVAIAGVLVAGASDRLEDPSTRRPMLRWAATVLAVVSGAALGWSVADGFAAPWIALLGAWCAQGLIAVTRRALRGAPLAVCASTAVVLVLAVLAVRGPAIARQRRATRVVTDGAQAVATNHARPRPRGVPAAPSSPPVASAPPAGDEVAALRERVAAWAAYDRAVCERAVEDEVMARLARYGYTNDTPARSRRPRGPVPPDAALYSADGRTTTREAPFDHIRVATPSRCPEHPAEYAQAQVLLHNPSMQGGAGPSAAWRARATQLAAALRGGPPRPQDLAPPVVAYSTRTLVSTGHVQRYMFGWTLDRYRATDSVAWVRLSDGAVLAAVNSWGTSWPTDAPSHTTEEWVRSTNQFHESEAAERADDALLASCRQWGLAD